MKKRQHYVPKFYLKNFSHNSKKDLVYCFDKTKEQTYSCNIKDICQEKFFYDFNDDKFETLESNSSKTLKKLISSQDIYFLNSTYNRAIITLFIAIQLLRTKEIRESLLNIISIYKMEVFSGNKDFKKYFNNASTDESLMKLQKRLFYDDRIQELTNILMMKKWFLLVNETETQFWTSDHPIVRFNPFFDPYGNMGLNATGIKIYFPLSPKLSLCLVDPQIYSHYNQINFNSNPITKKNLRAVKYKIDNTGDVLFQNYLQIKQSTRHIISNINEFEMAKSVIKENPSLKTENKERWKVSYIENDILHLKYL